jgi:signal transduction histidine kinase/ActR/RegA family two-component response regulator
MIFSGESEMAVLMRGHDWAATPLGPAARWPQALRTVVRLMLNTRHPMFVFWGPTHACLYNDAYRASIGPERHPSALGRPGQEVWEEIWPVIGPQIAAAMAGGATWHENHLVPITRHGRREDVFWTYSYSPIDDAEAAGGVGGVLVICTETTNQVRQQQRDAERAAARAAERDRLAQLFAQAPSFMALLSGPEHRIELTNQSYRKLTGGRDVEGRTVAEALPEAASQGYLTLLDQVYQSGEPYRSRGAKYVAPANAEGPTEERYIDFIYQPIRDSAGKVTGIFVEGADVTERTLASAALRDLNATLEQRVGAELAARIKTEELLHQSQKMEAVGQLTGGIAHDFNNMLQGVTGGIYLARSRIEAGRIDAAFGFLDRAVEAADRAAALTQRLLAFGRRQPLDPKPVMLDTLIGGLELLLQRTVGPGVTLDIRLLDDGWPVRCDPNQMESALLNLAINGRDAMAAAGGRLTIETAHVALTKADTAGWDSAEPGDYVCVTVADTGIGMTPNVLAHAFEPFFTTKPTGQGTGLGLSQLYGFVRQSHGIVRLESKPGVGTEARIYLPRCLEPFCPPPGDLPDSAAPPADDPKRVRTVLLVEDEEAVRMFAAEGLRTLGYRVLEASNGAAGIDALHGLLQQPRNAGLDLLVSDVGLPGGINGRQLAEAAREMVADLPILFITGYAGGAISLEGKLDPGIEILGKPFRLAALLERVQSILEKAPGERKRLAIPPPAPALPSGGR